MKFLKIALAAVALVCVGLFVTAAVTPIHIDQQDTTKTIETEPFLKHES